MTYPPEMLPSPDEGADVFVQNDDGSFRKVYSTDAPTPLPSEGESSGDFLKSLGDNADKWAEAFCSQFPSPLYTQEIVMGWFANAIEHSFDIRTGRRECAEHLLGLTPTTSKEKEEWNVRSIRLTKPNRSQRRIA